MKIEHVTVAKMSKYHSRTREGYKFLVEGETIHLAPVTDHSTLGTYLTGSEKNGLVGAGFVHSNGHISDWESYSYGVKTPKELRPLIERALKEWLASDVGQSAVKEDGLRHHDT